jgi:hypothetical protein
MRNQLLFLFALLLHLQVIAQTKWLNVDSNFGMLPKNFHVYKTTDSLDGKPFIAYYAEADLNNKYTAFITDSTHKRRLTPQQFYQKNKQPLLVVNGTFFSFSTNQNLNVLINDGKILSYNIHTYPGKGKDTFTYKHPLGSAIGISKRRKADVAWLYSDSSSKNVYAVQQASPAVKDSLLKLDFAHAKKYASNPNAKSSQNNTTLKKWKVKTAIGGGPVLLQNGEIAVSNNEELKFAGKAINDKHPRTCMGYTKDGKLIIMVIQGRYADAAGATLVQEAQLLKELGCTEALNLDGGGSSCLLINGKETIKPSDKEGERPVPGVFIIKAQ